MTPQNLKFQQLLFQQIKTKIGNQSLANLLAPILNLCPSTIYKKSKGRRPLAFHELIIIVRHFDIPIDELIHQIK